MARGGDNIRMPSSQAGITQYWDDVKTKIEMRPEYVVAIVVAVIILEFLLHLYGNAFFG